MRRLALIGFFEGKLKIKTRTVAQVFEGHIVQVEITEWFQRIFQLEFALPADHQVIGKMVGRFILVHQVKFQFIHHIVIKHIFIKYREERKPDSMALFFSGGFLLLLHLVDVHFLLLSLSFFGEHLEIRKIDLVGIRRKPDAFHFDHHHLLIHDLHHLAFFVGKSYNDGIAGFKFHTECDVLSTLEHQHGFDYEHFTANIQSLLQPDGQKPRQFRLNETTKSFFRLHLCILKTAITATKTNPL